MIALRGLLGRLRRAPAGRPPSAAARPSEAQAVAEQLVDLLWLSGQARVQDRAEGEQFHIAVGLCINALSKQPEVSAATWRSLAACTTPLLPSMPARQLTLALNAFTKANAASPSWLREACLALRGVSPGALSAQDLSLALNALARLAHLDADLVLRLLRDDAPALLPELAPQGLAGVAHASARLGEAFCAHPDVVREADVILRSIAAALATRVAPRPLAATCDATARHAPRQRPERDARGMLGPLELALATDALTRAGGGSVGRALPSWAETTLRDVVVPSLIPVLPELGPCEVVMVLAAFARRGTAAERGLAPGLAAALLRAVPRFTGAELAIAVHSGALLGLSVVDGPWHAPSTLVTLSTCGPPHVALFLHGLSQLGVQPPYAVWRLLVEKGARSPGALDTANCVRAVLAASKSDWQDSLIRDLVRDLLEHLPELGSEALSSLLYAQLHPYYFEAPQLLSLLQHAAGRRQGAAASFALQARAGLVAIQLLGNSGIAQAPLGACRDLRALAMWTEVCPAYTEAFPARRSELQADVERALKELLHDGHSDVAPEVAAWPFSIDIVLRARTRPLRAAGAVELMR